LTTGWERGLRKWCADGTLPLSASKEILMLLILLIILAIILLGGGSWGYSRYGGWSFGPLGLILIILVVLWALGYLR
jgi:hypothetical protein